jgi:transcriptional regulator with XRE-family HTH domain
MNAIIANRLRQARETAGISRRDLACQIGVAKTTLSGWELGDHVPALVLLKDFAARCNVSVTWIIGEVDDMNWRPSMTSGTPGAVHRIEGLS